MSVTTNTTLDEFTGLNQTTEPTFGDDMTPSEFRDACEEYARYAVDEYDTFDPVNMDDVRVEQSQKLERAAGKAGVKAEKTILGIQNARDMFMRFAFDAYQEWGFEEFKRVIRHELIHITQFENGEQGGHGFGFKRMAEEVDTDRHCEQFTDYDWLLFCSECGKKQGGRHRKSKVVTDPEETNYVSSCCKATLESEKA